MEGYLGDVEVQRVRRVDVLVLARKGQDALKRAREESLSIVTFRITRSLVSWYGMIIGVGSLLWDAEDLFQLQSGHF